MSGPNQACLARDCETVNINIGDQAQVILHAGNQGTHAVQANQEGWWNDSPEKIIGKHVDEFVEKLNAYTWKNIQGVALEEYRDFSQSEKEFYPQLKTGFDLYRGDYVPQEGFSAQTETKVGKTTSFQECLQTTQRNKGKPFTIIGQPGSGKTVMMKRLAKRMILGKKQQNEKSFWTKFMNWFRKDSEAILHLNIRDIPNLENATLAQVLFSPSVIIGLTKLEAQYGLQAIIENKIKITIFLDGLDQANWYPDTKMKVGPWTKTDTASIFGNILAGHLLSDIPITISSREHSIACLPLDMRPEFITALVGFAETDAKRLYCQHMGDGADHDWEEMRMTNPGMMYMCLTPLFLIFYMITRKKDPDDPPDCASGVMIRIIQILLESDHTQNVVKVINKLKKMAFQGTKEQRVVFSHEDLKAFDINYNDVSDVIIKVAGLNILGQRLLDGMYRFFFSHQTLQEALSALHVAEMNTRDFNEVVLTEFHKPYWSVVRNFSCGILKNERVRNKINHQILKQNESEAKWEYLKENLESHLRSIPTPAQKLDLFMALKEANALEILQSHAENLDFSDSQLTPSMINVLCSVMKHLKHVPSLSLANCDLDDVLLEVLASRSENIVAKIEQLDVRGNLRWTDSRIWKKIFENLSISNCLMNIPRNKKDECNIFKLLAIVNAANINDVSLNLGELDKMNCGILELSLLFSHKVEMKISKLQLQIHQITFHARLWHSAFQSLNFDVDDCAIESHSSYEANVLVEAAKAVNVDNVKSITLQAHEFKVEVTIMDFAALTNPKFRVQINYLCIKSDDVQSFDSAVWRHSFREMTFHLRELLVEPPRIKGEIDFDAWRDAVESASNGKVEKIMLHSTNDSPMTINDVISINKSGFHHEMDELYIEPVSESFDVDVWRRAFEMMTIRVCCCIVESPRSTKREIDINVEGAVTSVADHSRNSTEGYRQRPHPGIRGLNYCELRQKKPSLVIEAARAADVENVKSIHLRPKYGEICVTLDDIKLLNTPKYRGHFYVMKILMIREEIPATEDWIQFANAARKFEVRRLEFGRFLFLPDLEYFAEGYDNITFRRITILLSEEVGFYVSVVLSGNENEKFLDVELPYQHLFQHADDVGIFIRSYGFSDLVFWHDSPVREFVNAQILSGMLTTNLTFSLLASGMNGFKIKRLATNSFDSDTISYIIHRTSINVERIYLNKGTNGSIASVLWDYVVVGLPRTEWEERFKSSGCILSI